MARRLALAALALTVAGCSSPFATCLANPNIRPQSPLKFGVGIPTDADEAVTQIEAGMTFLEQAGVTWARVPISWAVIQPTRTTLNWRTPDFLIESAKRHGVKLHLVVSDTAPWSSAAPFLSTIDRGSYPPGNFEDWYRFMLLLAGRYGANVSEWEIGDGIDTRKGWNGRPEQYARYIGYASKAIKALNPKSRVILGSVTFGPERDSQFLDTVLADRSNPVEPAIDAVALRPGAVTPGQARDRFYALRRSLLRRDINAPILITGISWSSDGGRQAACDGYQGGETGQARYLREAMPWLVESGAERVYWEHLFDGLPDTPSGSLGLVDRQLQAKAALGALAGIIDPNRVAKPAETASDVGASPSPSGTP